MTDYDLQELERQYPEKKPVCLNYATARELILRLARENIALRRMVGGQQPIPGAPPIAGEPGSQSDLMASI